MKELIKEIAHELSRHLFDYLLLISAGLFMILALQAFRGERALAFIIILAFAAFYIVWGVYHHVITRSARLKTVIEYILIGFTILFLIKIIIFP